MKVIIKGKRVTLKDKDVLGTGGEATVIRWDNQAVKLYHQPNPWREAKLRAFLTLAPRLPVKVVAPQELVLDELGQQVLGFTMTALPVGYEPLARLYQRGFRDGSDFDTRKVVELLLDVQTTLQAIHTAGLVVGDLNDANELFCGKEVAFIDTDSYQFGTYPCLVATQDYLDPQLYNADLAQKPMFIPANDWYSFAVLAFRALLLMHPYGGTHPTLKQLTKRAQAGVTVLDSGVIYPKIGLNPKLLTDDLAQLFQRIFGQGWRGIFPPNALLEYRDTLQECSACHSWYPYTRVSCPTCSATAAFVMPPMLEVSGLRVEEFLAVNGKIVYWRLLGDTFYCITHEEGQAVLYSKALGGVARRQVLFRQLAGAHYELSGEFLAVNLNPGSGQLLLLIDLTGDKPQGLAQTTTNLFGNQQAMFGCSGRYLYRIAGGMLMRGEIKWGQLIERPVTGVLENQTWFAVAPETSPGNETILGYSRLFNAYEFFLINRDGRNTAEVALLQAGESLVDIKVVFSGGLVLLGRRTRLLGQDWLRLEVLNSAGKVINSRRAKVEDFGNIQSLTGIAFAHNLALLPTDEGTLRVDLASGQQILLTNTQPHVGDGDGLIPFGRGLLAISDNRVTNLILTGK